MRPAADIFSYLATHRAGDGQEEIPICRDCEHALWRYLAQRLHACGAPVVLQGYRFHLDPVCVVHGRVA